MPEFRQAANNPRVCHASGKNGALIPRGDGVAGHPKTLQMMMLRAEEIGQMANVNWLFALARALSGLA